MISRFEGQDGYERLLEVMLEQKIVLNNREAAIELISGESPAFYKADEKLLNQGDDSTDVHFILTGEIGIFVNERPITTRAKGQLIGELSAIDPTEARSATAIALVNSVILSVGADKFISIANKYPEIWHRVSKEIGNRLRQRYIGQRIPNSRPYLFIGSSVEGLKIAEAIQLGLKHAKVQCKIWTNGVFGPDRITLDSLIEQVEKADFALFVFGPDDKVQSRKKAYEAPRDNVIFEMGMFLSSLSRKRTYMIMEQNTDLKIPSDLLGITPITYVFAEDEDLSVTLGPVCTEIKDVVERHGPI